jgi:hypothetical protein
MRSKETEYKYMNRRTVKKRKIGKQRSRKWKYENRERGGGNKYTVLHN